MKPPKSNRFYPHLEQLEDRSTPAVFVVNSIDDFGDKQLGDGQAKDNNNNTTLRAALQEAEALGGEHTINFAIGMQGTTQVIALTAALDKLAKASVYINGATQLDPQAKDPDPAIVIDGQAMHNGFHFESSGNTIRWLTVIQCMNIGIGLFSGSGNTVEYNFLGVRDGQAKGNVDGIAVSASNGNVIKFNTITGNSNAGVVIEKGATGTEIYGNYIGVLRDGQTPVGKQRTGVAIAGSPGNFVGGVFHPSLFYPYNTISNNTEVGVQITNAGADGNVVAGNFIGTNSKGAGTIPNGLGVAIRTGTNNRIGAVVPLQGGSLVFPSNVISANDGPGVQIDNSSGNKLYGNFIGVANDGVTPLPNDGEGVIIRQAMNNIVGDVGGGRNVIAANKSSGVHFFGVDAKGNVVRGNRIGRDNAGNVRKNDGNAVVFEEADKSANTVDNNEIAFVGTHGVYLASSSGVTITNNWITGTAAAGLAAIAVLGTGSFENLLGENVLIDIEGGASAILFDEGASDNTASANDIYSNDADAVVVAFANSITIAGNDIHSNAGVGVLISGGTGHELEDNTVTGNTIKDIRIIGASVTANGFNVAGFVEFSSATLAVIGDYTQAGGGTNSITSNISVTGSFNHNAGSSNFLNDDIDILGSLTANGGTLILDGVYMEVTAAGGVQIGSSAIVYASGVLAGNLTNAGQLYIGIEEQQVGLTIIGNFTQIGSGQLIIMHPSERLSVSGLATLAGMLKVRGIESELGPFDLIDWGAVNGTFGTIDLPLPPPYGQWVWSYVNPEGHFTLWLETY
ncbi:MAG: right-handed parallel beta-helix repeat-containing protein [Gemmataceae bacterium]|nr:right-handed parallel beta-helix repeat-containing protein [Gemmataceae bacterium]